MTTIKIANIMQLLCYRELSEKAPPIAFFWHTTLLCTNSTTHMNCIAYVNEHDMSAHANEHDMS